MRLIGKEMAIRCLAGIRSLAIATAALAGILLAEAAAQEGRIEGLALSGDKPIQIESDKLQVQDEKGTATFSGNVKVVQGDTVMQAGFMTVHYARDGGGSAATGSSKIDRIDVRDKVYIRSDDQEATADKGVFNMKSEIVELTGKQVVLSQGDNVLVGCKLTVFLKTSEARVERCPNATGTSSGRVRMQIDPGSRKK
mgnify:FL=1